MKRKIKEYFGEWALLLKNVSPVTTAVFVLALFSMNLLANKSVSIPVSWLALDCGIIVSWVIFLCLDVFTRRYGPTAATKLSLFALAVNLFACLILFLASLIPGTWGAFYDYGEAAVVNDALDSTFGGAWYVIVGSSVAFAASAVINNFVNWGAGRIFRKNPDGFIAYACRSYLSTAVAQFADNLIFAFAVSYVFFGWSAVQCVTCAATGMVAELLCEVVFSPVGYRVCRSWQKRGVGKEYLDYIAAKRSGAAI